MARWYPLVLCFLALVPDALAQQVSAPCAAVERNTGYWVFGSNATYAAWLKHCAAGNSPVEALIGAQGSDAAVQAAIRGCAAEQAEAMKRMGLEESCQKLAKEGPPKPVAVAMAAPAVAIPPGVPPCVMALAGPYTEVVSQRVMFMNVETEVDVVWRLVEGKPFKEWKIRDRDFTGTDRFVGFEGSALVFQGTSNSGGPASRDVLTFDPACQTYTGTFQSAGGGGTIRGQKASP